ncbi:MAG TPA: DUF1573 domain-containing protein [Pirellulaceae bacterium]|nr:DUF1573 domain-containing protein [Pirellulaceae bacterium]HMO92603.1 DUF1573 domain-containing protein [Pirellulaceae bacterium]HMP70704.1 DUF1573 domain-containing protein [Pirellulaceae bacterium]
MKSLLFALLVIVTAASAHELRAQTNVADMFEIRKHEFGVVAANSKTVYVFKLNNKFSTPVHISGARTSCGCTLAHVKTPVVEPGQLGEIEATFVTTAFRGQHGANITVTITQPYFTEVQLRVDGFIRSDVYLDPGDVNFGSLLMGNEHSRTIDVLYAGKLTWALESIRNSNPHLKAELIETKREGTSVNYQLKVTIDPQMSSGFFHEEIRLVTNEPNRTIPVTIKGLLNSSIQVPSVVDLGRIRPGEVINKVVVVNSERMFTVLGVENSDNRIEITRPTEQKKTHIIKLTFNANRPDELHDEIVLKTDDPIVPETRFRVSGSVLPEGK